MLQPAGEDGRDSNGKCFSLFAIEPEHHLQHKAKGKAQSANGIGQGFDILVRQIGAVSLVVLQAITDGLGVTSGAHPADKLAHPTVENGVGNGYPQEISLLPHAVEFPLEQLLDFLICANPLVILGSAVGPIRCVAKTLSKMSRSTKAWMFCLLWLMVAERAPAQSNYAVVSLDHPGKISGTVKWSGPVPQAVSFPINKDPSVCDPDSKHSRDLERLIVGPQGGVANTVVFLKNISSGKAFDFPEARRSLNQVRCRYEPHILLVAQNAELGMKSSDATLHTVHMDGAATYNLPFPFPNQVITRPMPSAGVVNLKCNGGHVWMNAEVLVAPHPYYAVTDESGRFELTGVPAGDYQIVAWHEGWNLLRRENAFDVLTERRIQRPIFSEPKTWEKKISVTPDEATDVTFLISDK